MRPETWLTIPQPRPPRPSWWDRHGGHVLVAGMFGSLFVLDLLGL